MDKNRASKALRIASILCAITAAIIEVVSVLVYYDGTSNYFKSQSLLPTIAVILALLGTAIGIVSAITINREFQVATIFSDKNSPSPATIGFLTASIFTMIYCSRTIQPAIGVLSAILLLCGAIYCILTSIPALRAKKNLAVLFGILAILGTILLNAYYYFDVSLEMNAPFKLTTQMGLLCATVYLTGEIRFLLGTQKPKFFLGLCTMLVSIGSLCSLSLLVAFFLDKTDRGDYVTGALLVFCMILSALLRMRNLLAPTVPDNTEETAEVEE